MRYVDFKRATERYLARPRIVVNKGGIVLPGLEGHYSQQPHVINGIPVSRRTMKHMFAPISQLMEERRRFGAKAS